WIARQDSEDFAGLVNYSHDFQPGARRFDVGERSNFALMPVAEASLKLILEWTVPRISETLRLRTGAIAERARAEFASSACRPTAARVTISDCAFAAACRRICRSARRRQRLCLRARTGHARDPACVEHGRGCREAVRGAESGIVV